MLRRSLKEIPSNNYLKDLIEDLERLIDKLIDCYKPLRIILAGSLAKGKFVRGLSDIDLLIITSNIEASIDRFIVYNIEDVDVEVTIVTEDELREALELNRDFYVRALNKGIVLYSRDN